MGQLDEYTKKDLELRCKWLSSPTMTADGSIAPEYSCLFLPIQQWYNNDSLQYNAGVDCFDTLSLFVNMTMVYTPRGNNNDQHLLGVSDNAMSKSARRRMCKCLRGAEPPIIHLSQTSHFTCVYGVLLPSPILVISFYSSLAK